VLVEPARQRQALEFIEKNVFDDAFFAFSPELLNHLAPSRWWHDGTRVSYTIDFPVHQYIGLFQWWNLTDRLSPGVLRRIQDAEMKTTGKDKLTVSEYIQRVQAACWNDVTAKRCQSGKWDDGNPFISSIRRSLQREYLGLMEPLVREGPGEVVSPDLHAMLTYSLRALAEELQQVIQVDLNNPMNPRIDFASKAHLTACKSRIDRMLSAELKEYEPLFFGGGMFFRETGSPKEPAGHAGR
jgi:hypothetical protein